MDKAHIGPVFDVSEETFLLGRLLNKLGSTGLGWKSFGPPFPFWSWLGSMRGSRPIVDFVNFTPTIAPQNSGSFSLVRGGKVGF